MLTKIGERLVNRLTAGIARAQAPQRPYHLIHAMGLIAGCHPQRLRAWLVGGRAFPISRCERSTELLRSMIKVEHLDPQWQRFAEITPVVRRAISHFHDL